MCCFHNCIEVMKTTHLAATYSTQPQWGVLHPLFPREGLVSDTIAGLVLEIPECKPARYTTLTRTLQPQNDHRKPIQNARRAYGMEPEHHAHREPTCAQCACVLSAGNSIAIQGRERSISATERRKFFKFVAR